MDIEHATKVFNAWHGYMEIAAKLDKLFLPVGGIPESLLPYPKKEIQEAIDIILECYKSEGNKKQYDAVVNTELFFLEDYIDDEKAIELLANSKMLKDKGLQKTIAETLKEVQETWLDDKRRVYTDKK
jgi:hypothetical protein